MKVAIVQFNPIVGAIGTNKKRIIDFIDEAKSLNASLVIFPELSLCGYPPLDLLDYSDFVLKCEKALSEIAIHCKGIAAIVGSPQINSGKGKPMFNSAWFINQTGKIEKVIKKTLLPNYDVFDEPRYFEPNMVFETINYLGKNIAITICEDIWFKAKKNGFLNAGIGSYQINPVEQIAKLKPDFVINISASPYASGKYLYRQKLVKETAGELNCPLIYVNQSGANTEIIFDGGAMVALPNQNFLFQAERFKENIEVIDLSNNASIEISEVANSENEIEQALVLGISDFFKKQGFKKAILGLSGGIDSALTLYLAVKALGEKNVLPVMLPSAFSSHHSITDSEILCANLNCKVEKIEIDESFKIMLKALNPFFKELPFSLAEENLQARIRGVLLMGLSNKFGHILLNTTNKSEMAVGYGTLYGDLCGGLSVLGDVYKTQVFDLCRFINREREIIPQNILNKPPSAELRPNQKDSDSLPAYDILDNVLKLFLEDRLSIHEIISGGVDADVANRIISMVNASEYKRKQSPPVLRISEKAFGIGRRMPLVAKFD